MVLSSRRTPIIRGSGSLRRRWYTLEKRNARERATPPARTRRASRRYPEGAVEAPSGLVPEVRARVDGVTLHENFVVEVRARGTPGVAGVRDHLTPLDALAVLHEGLREVAVERADLLAVVDDDRNTVLRLRAGEEDRPARGRADRRAGLGVDVEAAVELGDARPRREAGAELAVHAAAHGRARRKRRPRLAGARHQAVQGPQIVALLLHALREPLQLGPDCDPPGDFVPRRDPRGNLDPAATDTLVARARSELGTERFPDARVELAPAHDLLP